MSEKIIVLPASEEMLRRLVATRDIARYKERFYPILLKDAGQRRVAQGVVRMFILAIYDYTRGMPPIEGHLVYKDVPEFIDALVDDKEVAAEAKDFLEQFLKG